MAMPNHLVMVRHGNSEANVIQAKFKADKNAVAPEGFFDRHDSRMRLSALGREQADAAGEWLRAEFPEGFDEYYVSPLVRTEETAGRLALGASGIWLEDDRWRERDWGEFGILSEAEREALFERSNRLKKQHKWYWCAPGGESLSTGVRLRFERILNTLHREHEGQNIIAVTHRETIDVARFVLERMTPEQWLVETRREDRKVENCHILDYTRENPANHEVTDKVRWFRSICPWDPSKSWNGGDWIAIPPRKRLSDAELLASVEQFPPLLPDTECV